MNLEGSSAFGSNKNQTIDLNEVVGQTENDLRLIPCRTTLPSLIPNFTAYDQFGNALNVSDAKFNPRRGFSLTRDLSPGQIYTCCVKEECVSFRVSGE